MRLKTEFQKILCCVHNSHTYHEGILSTVVSSCRKCYRNSRLLIPEHCFAMNELNKKEIKSVSWECSETQFTVIGVLRTTYKGAKYPEWGVPDNALTILCGDTADVYQIQVRTKGKKNCKGKQMPGIFKRANSWLKVHPAWPLEHKQQPKTQCIHQTGPIYRNDLLRLRIRSNKPESSQSRISEK